MAVSVPDGKSGAPLEKYLCRQTASRTFLIDPVKDLNGHHFNMSTSLLSALTASGQQAVWLGHREMAQLSVPDGVQFIPAFSSTIYKKQFGILGRMFQMLFGRRRFIRKIFPETRAEIFARRKLPLQIFDGDRLAELEAALGDLQPTSADRLVVHSADPQTIEMLAVWASRRSRISQPSICIRTCWSDRGMPFVDYGGGFAAVAQRLASVARDVVFSAETVEGAKKLQGKTGLKFSHCPPFIDTMVLENEVRRSPGENITVGWLGDPRREKGAELLPAIVESVRKSQNGRRLKFLFQCSGKNKRWLGELNAQLKKFDVAVERIPAGASRQVYSQAFQRCDIILIPYDAKLYPPERGSGIAIEALLAGKPIVATPGTFAATLVTPGTGIIGSDAASLAAGILEVAAHYDAFWSAARRRSEELLPSYDPISVLSRLTGQSNEVPSPEALE